MASETIGSAALNPGTIDSRGQNTSRGTAGISHALRRALAPLASLRLTVVLFALSIFLVFAGTLAQVEKDIWEVMGLYFRVWFAWVPLQIFFPKVFFPSLGPVPGGFYFPGGFLIGIGLGINLLAAHGLRFTIQARGTRLIAGLLVIALGAALTWLVVMGGSGTEVIAEDAPIHVTALWTGVKIAFSVLWLTLAYAVWSTDKGQRLERWLMVGVGIPLGVVLAIVWWYGMAATPDPAAMRILWQLVQATSASLVLLAGCVLLFRKRAGIVLLHAGVGLMMANELVVYSLHQEGMMRLFEGDSANYAEDIRSVELAIVEPVGEADEVTVIPRRLLTPGRTTTSQYLPFDVQVLDYFQNSMLVSAKPGETNGATAGEGLKFSPESRRPISGVEVSKEVDIASAYVKLLKKGTDVPLGTYLVSQELQPQKVEVDGLTYQLGLRFLRDYKPYTVKLIDVRRDDYIGTDKPRNYSSDVEILAADGSSQSHHIRMNNPLRYAGDTLYQSGHTPTAQGEISTLQVVKNTGWMIPYVACMIVAVGMCSHFSLTLVRFLRRRDIEILAPATAKVADAQATGGAKQRKVRGGQNTTRWQDGEGRLGIVLPALVVLLCAGWLAGKTVVPKPQDKTFNLYEFGELPLVYEGRVKPIDTLARNSLTILSGKQEFKDAEGQRQPAILWFLDLVTRSDDNPKHRVFRIDHPDVLATLHLEPRAGFLYSVEDIQPHLEEFETAANEARKIDVHSMNTQQKKLFELEKKLNHYAMLLAAFDPPKIRKDHVAEDVLAALKSQQGLLQMPVPLTVPPVSEKDRWKPFSAAWTEAYAANLVGQKPNPNTLALESLLVDYGQNKTADFDRDVTKYREQLAADLPADVNLKKLDFEARFNHAAPFYWLLYLDLFAFVLTVLAWFGWSRLLNRTALWLLIFTFVAHTLGLAARIYISGRPPVTNLYSSALFIGWGCMLLGIVLECIYRLGIGNLIASVAAFATLLIAHYLAADGDTLIVMQAVLDTQFWLATHVVCITLGYATTFVAGLLGLVYVLRGMLTRSLTPEVSRNLSRMIYGTLCFAIFFSFVGTVLGGLWADDSWGRFWGWDPKENGALIIVLWNALVLHARWGAMVKERGLAVLAVAGNIVTAWSWFGVNELGAGLHSYGFTEGVALALAAFVLSQFVVIGIGSLPKHYWLSSRGTKATV